MDEIDRRSAMSLGFTLVAATPLVALATPAAAAMYGLEDGEEIMPGVRQVKLGEFPATFGGYAKAVLSDWIYAPGVVEPSSAMPNDMICQMIEGELLTKLRDEEPSISKVGRLWTCAKDALEQNTNQSDAIAVMRVIDLLPA
jgi:hypothetical protein